MSRSDLRSLIVEPVWINSFTSKTSYEIFTATDVYVWGMRSRTLLPASSNKVLTSVIIFYRNIPMLVSGIKSMRIQLGNGLVRYSTIFMRRRLACSVCLQRGVPPPLTLDDVCNLISLGIVLKYIKLSRCAADHFGTTPPRKILKLSLISPVD
jgi:hypothetical protein